MKDVTEKMLRKKTNGQMRCQNMDCKDENQFYTEQTSWSVYSICFIVLWHVSFNIIIACQSVMYSVHSMCLTFIQTLVVIFNYAPQFSSRSCLRLCLTSSSLPSISTPSLHHWSQLSIVYKDG